MHEAFGALLWISRFPVIMCCQIHGIVLQYQLIETSRPDDKWVVSGSKHSNDELRQLSQCENIHDIQLF